MKDTFRDMERKSIAQQAQEKQGLHAAFADERISLKVGFRSYRFMTWCGCGHLHLIADGGAILEVCGGDCVAHPYALRQQGTQATEDSASGWSEREEVVQSVLLQCAENGIPITRHAVRIILEQISQNREALDFLARH